VNLAGAILLGLALSCLLVADLHFVLFHFLVEVAP
jgi:hypothetical protein